MLLPTEKYVIALFGCVPTQGLAQTPQRTLN